MKAEAVAPEPTESGPRHQQVIVSIFGLYARGGVSLPVSRLIELMADLGVEGPAVRSSMSRLKKRGVVRALRVDGVAAYQLAPHMEEVFEEGDARIFAAPRAVADDPWLLAAFSVPEEQRGLRHQIRSLLTQRGFGSVVPGVWIAPKALARATERELRREGLDAYVEMFEASPLSETPGDRVRQWWDLDAIARQYRDFLARYDDVVQRWGGGDPSGQGLDDRTAFVDLVRLVTDWRRLPYLDPGLPAAFLPEPWPGIQAQSLFAGLWEQLQPRAERHVRATLGAR